MRDQSLSLVLLIILVLQPVRSIIFLINFSFTKLYFSVFENIMQNTTVFLLKQTTCKTECFYLFCVHFLSDDDLIFLFQNFCLCCSYCSIKFKVKKPLSLPKNIHLSLRVVFQSQISGEFLTLQTSGRQGCKCTSNPKPNTNSNTLHPIHNEKSGFGSQDICSTLLYLTEQMM